MPRLTKTVVESAAPAGKTCILWDSDLPGFGLRVSPSGLRTYLFKYRVGGGRKGRPRKPSIGRHGALTCDEARSIAKLWAADVARGGDPAAARRRASSGPTVADLAEKYLAEHAEPKKRAGSVAADRRLLDRFILSKLAGRPVAGLDRADVGSLHHGLRATPYQANRALALLSKMMNLAERWGWRADGSNPCRHVDRFPEAPRQRFLSPAECDRLGQALTRMAGEGTLPWQAAGAIRLLLLTGCRRDEIRTLRWRQIDLDRGLIRLDQAKGGPRWVHLAPAAVALLNGLHHDSRKGEDPVFPGRQGDRPLADLERPWQAVRAQAGLDDVRLHDLRHTYASIAVAGGLSLPIVGRLLGHASPSMTARYAHLADDPVRRAAALVGEQVERGLSGSGAPALPQLPPQPVDP